MRIGTVAALAIFAPLVALASCEQFRGDASDADASSATDASSVSDADGGGASEGGASDVGAPLTYAATVLADGPLLYFRLGEQTASGKAVDLGSLKQDATFAGHAITGVPGAIAGDPDTASRFDGTTAAVVLANGPTFGGTAPFSVEAWVRPSTTSGAHVFAATQGETAGGWAMFFDSDPGPTLERHDSAVGGSDKVHGGAVSTTRFAHVVGTFDGTTQRLYVDGSLVGSMASNKVLPGPGGIPFSIGANGMSAQINFFEGDIDEVAIYDHALSNDRVVAHLRIGRGVP